MNGRPLSGVLMVGAAAALAWAWLTGRLDGAIAQVVAQAQGKAGVPSTPGSSGRSGLTPPSGGAGRGSGGGGGGSW